MSLRTSLFLSVPLALALAAPAQVTCYSDHTAWVTAAGAPTATEDFSSFNSDTTFEGSVVTLAVGTITVSSGGVGFRNLVDVPPFTFSDNGGTSHASCFTNYDEPTLVRIDFSTPVTACGAICYSAEEYEMMTIEVYSGVNLLGTCTPIGNGPQFTGFTSVQPFDAIVMRSINWYTGSGGEGFGLDDIEIVGGSTTSAYCTAGTTTHGCVPSIGGTGSPSATAGSGFTIAIANVEGQKSGLVFYGISGSVAVPWGTGSASWLCVKAPTQRMTTGSSGGTVNLCDGTLAIDWNAFIAANPSALGVPFSGGETVKAQGWFRDPPAPKTTNLSDALSFVVGP